MSNVDFILEHNGKETYYYNNKKIGPCCVDRKKFIRIVVNTNTKLFYNRYNFAGMRRSNMCVFVTFNSGGSMLLPK
jgi:hypothetical protein